MTNSKTKILSLLLSLLVLTAFHSAMAKGVEPAKRPDMELVGELYKGPLKVSEFVAPLSESSQFMLVTNQLLMPAHPKIGPGHTGITTTSRKEPRQLKVSYEVTSLDKSTSNFGVRVIMSESNTESNGREQARSEAVGIEEISAHLETTLEPSANRAWVFPLGVCDRSLEDSLSCYRIEFSIL